jgi:hypothetical protein
MATTLNIPNTPTYSNLISMIEEIMNPSAKMMREFQEKLNESELALLFNAVENANTNADAKKKGKSVNPKKLSKAPRNQTKAAEDGVRCEALVFAYEMNDAGQLVPSRCKRCIEENTKFCKQHGAPDGNPWKGKQRGDLETIAEFKWQHLGTVDAPSPIFELEKAKAELLKNYKAKQQLAANAHSDHGSDDDGTAAIKKAVKATKVQKPAKEPKEKKSSKAVEEKPKKRVANGYIFYKSLKHQEIKQQLMLENPEIKGKELANKITSVASEQWKQLSEAEQAQYKKQAKDSIAETLNDADATIEPSDCEDTPLAGSAATPIAAFPDIHSSDDAVQSSLEIPSMESEDEEDTLVFNEKHNVWVDTDNNLCYETKDTNPGPIGQVQRGQFLRFPTAKK